MPRERPSHIRAPVQRSKKWPLKCREPWSGWKDTQRHQRFLTCKKGSWKENYFGASTEWQPLFKQHEVYSYPPLVLVTSILIPSMYVFNRFSPALCGLILQEACESGRAEVTFPFCRWGDTPKRLCPCCSGAQLVQTADWGWSKVHGVAREQIHWVVSSWLCQFREFSHLWNGKGEWHQVLLKINNTWKVSNDLMQFFKSDYIS